MDTRTRSRRKLSVTVGFITLLLTVSLTMIGVLAARAGKSAARMTMTPPNEMSLGVRYPVMIELRLPWGRSPYDSHPTISEPLSINVGDSRRSGFGWGVTEWTLECEVTALTIGTTKPTILNVPLEQGAISEFEIPSITVSGTLGGTDGVTPALASLPPVIPVERSSWPAWVFAVCVLGGAATLLLRRKSDPAVAEPTAAARFTENLKRLEGTISVSTDAFHQGLTDTVREYLAQAWHLPIATATTREFLTEMKTITTVPVELRTRIREYLEQSDLARYAPREDVARRSPGVDGAKGAGQRSLTEDVASAHLATSKELFAVSERALKEAGDG